MEQKTLARWLKVIILGVGLFGAVFYGVALPVLGREIAEANPEFAWCFWPWLDFLWASGVPCYGVLVLGWRIASNIGKDRSFSPENAKFLQWASWLAAGDSAFFFLMNLIYFFLGMNHPGVVLYSLLVVFAGVCMAVVFAVLSHLVGKAARLQEESDLTI